MPQAVGKTAPAGPVKPAASLPAGPPKYSNIDLVNRTDSFPSAILHPAEHSELLSKIYRFVHEGQILGYITPLVAAQLARPEFCAGSFTLNTHSHTITLHGETEKERSANIAKTLDLWRKNKTFKILKGWRNELYEVYAPKSKLLFRLERSAAPLFGVRQSGVHMTAFMRSPKYNGGYAVWVPRRARTKATYPSALDNTVAGGISAGYGPLETMIKECEEEASFPEALVRERIKCVGTISYILVREKQAGGETGLYQPGNQITYDLDLTGREDVIPQPCDDEVEGFELMELDELKRNMAAGNFKPNSACVLLDFFIRHGILTPENEPNYFEILIRLHRSLEFPGPDMHQIANKGKKA
ncbi:hypothetical protein DFH27DRAFT_523667 [Peziza echinospora]|nr:hypothetical protein DFH27DRAFT_523667 [Peziza echinospora]